MNYKLLLISTLIAVGCWHSLDYTGEWGGAKEDSVSGGGEKHSINFYGIFTDANNKKSSIENIAIGNKFRQIPVYAPPKNEDTKPDTNTSFIDLAEIREISLPSADPRIEKFAGREYITIMTISNDKKRTQHTYLVEVTREISCHEVNEAGPIERKIKFEALGKLKIKGYRYRDSSTENKKERKKEKVFEEDDEETGATGPVTAAPAA